MKKGFLARKEEISTAYAAASHEKEYGSLWNQAKELEKDMKAADEFAEEIGEAIYSGLWAGYYYILKFARTKENVDKILEIVSLYYLSIDRLRDPKLKISYGYLLEVITSELREDSTEAERLGEEVRQMVEETREVSVYLKEIYIRGLREEKMGHLEKAIKIFSEAEKKFPEARSIPDAQLVFAHCINNRAKCEILLSDEKNNPEVKRYLLGFAIEGLLDSMNIYETILPAMPVKHLEGVVNRLAMAAFRVFDFYGFYHAGDIVKRKLEARKPEEAIVEIREADRVLKERKRGQIWEVKTILEGIEKAQKIIAEGKNRKQTQDKRQ